MLLAFTIYPVELIQFTPLITKWYYISSSKTLRDWKESARPPPITSGYAKQYGYVLLSFAISMEFATVAPMILPFGVLFFGFGYVILRHHIYYVYDTPYDGEGRMFQWSMYVLCSLMIVVLLTLIGIFYSRKSPIQATCMWPLIIVVLLFWWYEEKKHNKAFETLSLQDMKRKENSYAGNGSSSSSHNKKRENTDDIPERKKLQIQITSRMYLWMVSHEDVDDLELMDGILFNGAACDVFLHPSILRSRLGQMIPETIENEKRKNIQLNKRKDINFSNGKIIQTEQERNILDVPRRSTANSDSGNSPLLSDATVDDEMGKKKQEETDDDDEMVAGAGHFFLFRSRWILWFYSQLLALLFIIGIYFFYHSHSAIQKSSNGTCLS
jgi:hypothetical protein